MVEAHIYSNTGRRFKLQKQQLLLIMGTSGLLHPIFRSLSRLCSTVTEFILLCPALSTATGKPKLTGFNSSAESQRLQVHGTRVQVRQLNTALILSALWFQKSVNHKGGKRFSSSHHHHPTWVLCRLLNETMPLSAKLIPAVEKEKEVPSWLPDI